MKRACILLFCLASARGEERLLWQLEGYPRLFEAAARARKEGKRLLLGLSGSPT
jgi:hypothetical protein